MALYNPILGDIPQPQPNSEEVFNPLIKKTNYGAQTVINLQTSPFLITLETSNTQTDSEACTQDVIITQIIINGYHHRDVGSSGNLASCDIYIGELHIASYNTYIAPSGVIPINANIAINHWRIGQNTLFKMISTAAGDARTAMNVSFIGYIPTNL